MSIVYAKSSGLVNAQIGRLETPIKMIIEHESDNLTKQGGVRDWLFNVESSDRFGETVVGQNEFGVFTSVEEGAGAENDDLAETYSKGMIQRLQIARGLINDPEILFMDEPTVGLDPLGARMLRDIRWRVC